MVQDRRSSGGGLGGSPMRMGAGLGVPGLIILLVALFFGGGLGGGGGSAFGVDNPFDPFQQVDQGGPSPPEQAELVDFLSFVFEDAQNMWAAEFEEAGQGYQPAGLVVFSRGTESGCGFASVDTGPFYCPGDQRVYVDLSFFRELETRFAAPGDFAQAYVIAHEVAHHVQTLTGVSQEVNERSRDDGSQANELSIRLELQADCLAGVWGFSTQQRGLLEEGDIEEGLRAAASVGDDRIQEQATGRIDPDTWTHGSSEQRVEWFSRGFESGSAQSCDTFAE